MIRRKIQEVSDLLDDLGLLEIVSVFAFMAVFIIGCKFIDWLSNL